MLLIFFAPSGNIQLYSRKDKLELLQKYYQLSGKINMDSVINADLKEKLEDRVTDYISMYKEIGLYI